MNACLEPIEEDTRDRPFDPFRVPRSANVKAIVADITNQLQSYENDYRPRKRKRHAVVQQKFEATISAVVCDLIHRAMTEPEGWIAVSLSNQQWGQPDRYRSHLFGKTFRPTLENLAAREVSLVELRKGQQGIFNEGRQTTIKAADRLLTWMSDHGIKPTDLGRLDTEEVIILKRTKTGYWDSGKQIDYKDTSVTRGYRQEVKTINQWIEGADIVFDPFFDNGAVVDDTDRRLKRHFNNGSFKQGGRLFGGFWQPLKKQQRQDSIFVNGEPVVTLDYAQMNPRILYSLKGVTPPERDAYLLPDLENHRKGVKKVFNSVLFSNKPLTRFPRNTKKLFPKGVTIRDVIERLTRVHPEISQWFFKGIGCKLFFTESEILVDVLLELRDQGVVALPIHDAVVVPQSASALTEEIMLEAFKKHTGVDGKVELEVVH